MKKYKIVKAIVHPHPEDTQDQKGKEEAGISNQLSNLKIGQRVTFTVRPLKDEN